MLVGQPVVEVKMSSKNGILGVVTSESFLRCLVGDQVSHHEASKPLREYILY